MPRPRKNNLDYFPHDNCMRNDRKLKAVRAKFGHIGYSVYNMFLEALSESNLLVIKWDEAEQELISGDFNIVSDELTTISDYLCKINLLKRVNGYIFCPKLDERSKLVFGKRTKDLSSLRIENGVILSETQVSGKKSTQSKVKESKEKKTIYIPTFEEFKIYALDNKPNVDLSSLELKYKSWKENGWKDGNNKKIENWKTKLLNTLPHIKEKVAQKRNPHSDFDNN